MTITKQKQTYRYKEQTKQLPVVRETREPWWSSGYGSMLSLLKAQVQSLVKKLRWASLIAQLVKESTYNAGDSVSIPGLGRSAGEEMGYPLQCSWASLVAQLVKNPPAM